MQQTPYWQQPQPQHHNDVKALIFGIISLVLFRLPLIPVGLGIAAIVFASKAKREYGANRNFAVAGQVTGIIGICLGALFAIYWAVCLVQMVMLLYDDYSLIPSHPNPEIPDYENAPGQPVSLLRRWIG